MHGETIKLTSTCFEQSYRSPSGGTTVYIQQLVYVSSIPILPTASQHEHMPYTSCCMYTVVPSDDEQQACSKHVEAYYLNKLPYFSIDNARVIYTKKV